METPNLVLESICRTDAKFFTLQLLETTNLPRGNNWLWNKSKPKRVVQMPDDIEISLYKLNTRKTRKAEEEPPPYKVWIFNVTNTSSNMILSFFWCERGAEEIEIIPVTLQDLSFLYPFTSLDSAKNFGWID